MPFLDIFGILRISSSVHFRHQKSYRHATVHKVWQEEQQDTLRALRDAGNNLFWQGVAAVTALDIVQSMAGTTCWSAQSNELLMSSSLMHMSLLN